MALLLQVNGKDTGRDWLHASVAGRRFPARVSITNAGPNRVEAELRVRPGGAQIAIAEPRLSVEPGATAETTIQALTTSITDDDTVLELLAAGRLEAEFRLTAISLARESYFHNLVQRGPTTPS